MIEDVSVSSSPVLAALGALVMALLVTGGVLQRDAAAQWLAQRPGTLTLVRAATRRSGLSASCCCCAR